MLSRQRHTAASQMGAYLPKAIQPENISTTKSWHLLTLMGSTKS
jgi:hypothetical protein